jgi:predicted regulator of Ras-like GTPase activity (Roadblock/LC7/MglB family)
MPEETMLSVLEDLLREEDILAVMLARKNESIIAPTEKFKLRDPAIFSLLQTTMNDFFTVIEKFSSQGLDRVYFELGDYVVLFYLLAGDTALVSITPAFSNRGLLEVEMENARRRIKKLIQTSD